jgi:hypothetical protein
MFVLTFIKFQSVSVEAVTCLLLMVQWVSPLFPMDTVKILDTSQPASQPASQQNSQPENHVSLALLSLRQ